MRDAIDDRDTAVTTARLLTENALQNAVTAFQRFAEAMYARLPAASKPRRNAFQNLAEGGTLWQNACGKGYDAYLDQAELTKSHSIFPAEAPASAHRRHRRQRLPRADRRCR